MKNFKYILATVAITPVLAFSATTVDLIADGGGIVTPDKYVGDVIVSDDGSDLTIEYKLDRPYVSAFEPKDNDGSWCITETHIEVGDDLSTFPLTKTGAPKIGNFSEKGEYECGSSVDPILVPIPNNDGTVTIGTHTVVKQMTAEPVYTGLVDAYTNITLPQEVNLTVWGGTDTYLRALVESNDDLNGTYPHSWCIDPNFPIDIDTKYSIVWAVSSYDPELLDLNSPYVDYIAEHIKYPGNLPMVNYVVNQFDDGEYNGYEKTKCSVQQAMWQITNGEYGVGHCAGWSIDNPADVAAAEAIIDDAAQNGADYKPGCNDEMVVVLIGDPTEGSSTHDIQTVIIHIPVPCKETWGEETAWGGEVDETTGLTDPRFDQNNWAMYFEHTITDTP